LLKLGNEFFSPLTTELRSQSSEKLTSS